MEEVDVRGGGVPRLGGCTQLRVVLDLRFGATRA